MKYALLSCSLIIAGACSGQTEVTVSTGPANALQTYYSLENGEQGVTTLADWDLAFEINSFNSSILVNTAKGLTVYETPVAVADWASLTTVDEGNWTAIYNSETYWSEGALTNGNNLSDPEGVNLGWGNYSQMSHIVTGSKVYVIADLEGGYRKLVVNSLVSGVYSFMFADLDGTNEQNATLVKANFLGKNFGYFNLSTNSTVDMEPAAADWDLLFTKYTSVILAPDPTPYGVGGVLQNKRVSVLQVDGIDPAFAEWTSGPLDSAMNVIGYDWKTFNMETFMYEYPSDRTYFVKDRTGNIWKLIFTAYGGGSNGDMTFTQELVSSVGLDENNGPHDLIVYPNPSNTGLVTIVLDRDVRNGSLSILDLSGKLVHTANVSGGVAMSAVPVDVSGLSQGLYMLRLESEGVSFTSRIAIER